MTTEITKPQDAESTDVLVPNVENRIVTIGVEPYVQTYIQRPLSFFQKLEVFSVLGGALDKSMSGPDGLTLSEVFETQKEDQRNLRDADTFVKAIIKLVQYAPDLLANLYVVILGVPRGERALITELMIAPREEGGLSDEDGLGILETFVEQNWDVMVDFFTSKITPLYQKINSKVQEFQPSKPLKTTRRTTPKQ